MASICNVCEYDCVYTVYIIFVVTIGTRHSCDCDCIITAIVIIIIYTCRLLVIVIEIITALVQKQYTYILVTKICNTPPMECVKNKATIIIVISSVRLRLALVT